MLSSESPDRKTLSNGPAVQFFVQGELTTFMNPHACSLRRSQIRFSHLSAATLGSAREDKELY